MSCKTIILNFIFSACLFCVSFYIAWLANASADFLYPTWYDALDLDEAISQYAPNNKYKNGFEHTDKQQHLDSFSGIVKGIQNSGQGLRKLSYEDKKNHVTETLLTEAEVIHLQDVANLVDKFKYLAIFGFILASLVFVLMKNSAIPIAKVNRHMLGGISVIFILIALVLLIGPTKVFYVGHELVFPSNHQWFFYYEDSLMSTMMEAPALFGPIAIQLLLATVLLWFFMLYCMQCVQASLKKV